MGVATFPIRPRDKKPAIREWQKCEVDCSADAINYYKSHLDSNIAILCGAASGNLFVIDIDTHDADGFEYLNKWEREHGELPETVSAKTGSNGTHLFYRSAGRISTGANGDLGIDVRGEGGYIVAPPSIHPNGQRYEWENHPEDYEIAIADENVMAFLKSIQVGVSKSDSGNGRKRFKLPEIITTGERNDILFRYACSLHEQGYASDHISDALSIANRNRCVDPLSTRELKAIADHVERDYEKGEIRKSKDDSCKSKPRFANKQTRHVDIGRAILTEHHMCFIDRAPALWVGNRYVIGWKEVDRAAVNLCIELKRQEQNEIRHFLVNMAERREAAHPRYVAFNNCIIDVMADCKQIANSPDLLITNVVPHDWNPEAYDETADRFLDDISCGDMGVRKNLEETIGLCMFRSSEYEQCPVLIGEGSNGKSTFIKAVRAVLGDDNVSSVDIQMMGKQFQAVNIVGKLANLGDDISSEFLNGDMLAMFRKVTSGEWIYTDVKNMDGFDFKPFCTFIISCNEFPKIRDATYGTLRRLVGIPFNATFAAADGEVDTGMGRKLAKESACQYLIRVGIEGLQRVIAQDCMTQTKYSEQIVEEINRDNNSVLQWIEDCGITEEHCAGNETEKVFANYNEWAKDSNYKPVTKAKFSRTVNNTFELESVPAKVNGRCARIYRVKKTGKVTDSKQ